MPIAFANLGTSANPDINDNTDAASYANSSWTPPTTGLIVVFVTGRNSTATVNNPTMSGNSLTWTQIASLTAGSFIRLALLAADPAAATTGATTVDFGGQTQIGCLASFFQVTGVDISGGIASAFVQSPSAAGTATSGSVTLAAAGNANNRPISAFTHSGATEATTPRANWTEIDDLSQAAPLQSGDSQFRDDAFETTASASWATSGVWIGIAAELLAQATGMSKTTRRMLLGIG